MKKTVIMGIFTALVVFGLVFTACDNDITETEGRSHGLTGTDLTGTITITAGNGLTTGAELTAVYTGTEVISYQWNKDGVTIPAAVSNKYIPPIAGRYTVTVSAEGYKSKTSAAVIITGATLPDLTGTVYVYGDSFGTGTIEVGQTLRAIPSLNGNGTISYQWNRGGTPIYGANGDTYIVQPADSGSTITLTVTRSGYSGSVTSDPITVPPALPGTVSIIGTAGVREILTADTSNLGGDGTISYQWRRKINDYYSGTSIGMNSNVYIVQSDDIGSTITVTVTRPGYLGVTSEPVGPVIDPSFPALTGTVSISTTGIAEIGQTLWANTNSLGGSGDIFYYWKRGTTNIGYSNAYFVPFADAGSTITVTVIRSGNSGSITSSPVVITSGEALQSTPGLAFTLNDNGTAYSVSRGTATANEIIIPAFYNGLPVTEIPAQAFPGMNMTSIRIPDTVTSIGQSAFYGCNSLTSITIPFGDWFGYIFGASDYYDQNSYIPPSLKTVIITGGTNIRSSAFYGCSGLTSITIPSSVTSIGNSAFSGCSGLTNITIPSSVTSIGQSAFSGCSSLTSVTIPSSVTSIGQSAFSDCSGLTSITIPSSVTSIGQSAFSGCSGLTNITIPPSVTSIGQSAFSGCSGLTNITIPPSVTSIGDNAFSNCTGLTSITIPSSVTSIGRSAFSGCSSLTSITIPFVGRANDAQWSWDTQFGYIFGASDYYAYDQNSYIPPSLKTVIITGGTNIRSSAFYGCSGLTSITIPSSVTSIGSDVFYGCSGLTSITIPSSVTSIGDGAFSGCSSLTSITIPSSVTSIGDEAFSGCSSLTSITIPSSVSSIGSGAFYGCSGLTSITIPSSVTSIGQSAFSGCNGLTSITIPFVGRRANDEWRDTHFGYIFGASSSSNQSSSIPPSLKTVVITGGTSIGDSAFSGCSGLTSITIPPSVTSIGQSAFSGCSGLTSITIPPSVTSIGQSAFSGCSGLTSITIPFVGGSRWTETHFGYIFGASSSSNQNSSIPSSLKTVVITDGISIGSNAFSGCSGLTSITIPSSVTSIGNSAFSGCSGLTSITIPPSVTSIGYSAFSGCSGLTSITIPPSVTSIGYSAFSDCNSLNIITIPFVGTDLNQSYISFSDIFGYTIPSSLKTVVITGGTSIGDHAFYGCNDLTSITIPSSTTSIGQSAFSDCSSLTSVTFQGTITSDNFSSYAFGDSSSYYGGYIGDLRDKYLAGGIGTYTRPNTTSLTWTKE